MMQTPSGQQQKPYLITSRHFPANDPELLETTLVKSYNEIAQAVNVRTIGIFEMLQIVTGERWFASSATNALDKRQTYRQVYTLPAVAAGATVMINHNITGINQFTHIYGTCITDQPDYRPIPYASVAANANIDIRVTSNKIIIANGAGSPNILSGIIVLEYLLN
jgi:hypothetical protein